MKVTKCPSQSQHNHEKTIASETKHYAKCGEGEGDLQSIWLSGATCSKETTNPDAISPGTMCSSTERLK